MCSQFITFVLIHDLFKIRIFFSYQTIIWKAVMQKPFPLTSAVKKIIGLL